MAFTSLDGVALITGAAAGIGQETGFAFAEAGASAVVFADINEQGALESVEASKKYATHPKYRAIGIKVDVTNQASVQAMVDTAMKEFGRIDYSVNSAGVNSSAEHTTDIEIEKYTAIVNVNLTGTMLCVSIVSKAMSTQEPVVYKGRHKERSLGRGCIVNIGSAASLAAGPNMLAYVASKHGVMGITKAAALDNAKYGIRVNAVCPSYVDTPMMERATERVPGLAKIIEKASPLKRSAVPEEVANLVVFCCSPSASYINGVGIPVDAGMMLTVRM